MSASTEFEKTPQNTIRRNAAKRGSYDKATVIGIFKAVPFVTVAFVSTDGSPQCMPMMGAIEEVDDEVYVYLHGSAVSRFIKTNKEGGSNLCISATVYDGFIFGLTPFSHSAQFRSAVLHGTVFPFDTDSEETSDKDKLHAMSILINSVAEGRWEQTRLPNEKELHQTGVIRVRIDSASAKSYGGIYGEQVPADLANEELKSRIWTGVVPIRTIALPAEPWDMNHVKGDAVPENIANFSKNWEARSLAFLPKPTSGY